LSLAGRGLDRRRFLARGVGLAAAAAAGGTGWSLVRDALGAVDPRLRALARELGGPVLVPGSTAYARARRVYNERFDGVHPLGIAQPASRDDVRAIVRWAARTGVQLAIRSGGHSYAGYSTTSGLVVDLARFGALALDAGGNLTAGAGARLVDIEARLAGHGRALPSGSCATVGIGGLALGGGVGLASRKLGTTSDNLVSVGIVTADGRYRTCSERENPDLFWACRGGGGGNFGVATRFVFRTHPVSSVSYFFASWPWTQVVEVVRAWQAFAPHAPDELFSICAVETGEGEPTVRCFGQFLGGEAALRRLLRPLTSVAGVRLTTGMSSYLSAQLRWAGCLGLTVAQCHLAGETPGGVLARARFAGKSDYVDEPLSPAAVRTIASWIERAQRGTFGSGALLFDSYGGALNRPRPDATAFVHRNALCSAQYLAYWAAPSRAADALAWIRAFHGAMRPHVSGFAYQNYIDRDLVTWAHAYYGANYPRLRAVKRAVDPERLFRFAQGVQPA
jgi:FAD/FMN-containing dehydrogenase